MEFPCFLYDPVNASNLISGSSAFSKSSLYIWKFSVHKLLKPRLVYSKGFPDSSVGKEFACNTGDPGSIPGLGITPEEGIGYPLQYSWASLVAQLVKNPPAMQETPVQFLGQEEPLEKQWATHSSILGLPLWLSW